MSCTRADPGEQLLLHLPLLHSLYCSCLKQEKMEAEPPSGAKLLQTSNEHSRKASDVWRTPGRRLRCCPVHRSPGPKDWPSPGRSGGTPAGGTHTICWVSPPAERDRAWLKQTSHSGDGGSTAEPGQLHQLVHAEAVLTEELLVNLLGLLLPAEQSVTCFYALHMGQRLAWSRQGLPQISDGVGHGGCRSATPTLLLVVVSRSAQLT